MFSIWHPPYFFIVSFYYRHAGEDLGQWSQREQEHTLLAWKNPCYAFRVFHFFLQHFIAFNACVGGAAKSKNPCQRQLSSPTESLLLNLWIRSFVRQFRIFSCNCTYLNCMPVIRISVMIPQWLIWHKSKRESTAGYTPTVGWPVRADWAEMKWGIQGLTRSHATMNSSFSVDLFHISSHYRHKIYFIGILCGTPT